MSTIQALHERIAGNVEQGRCRVYAIAFDLNIDALKEHYTGTTGVAHNNAYTIIRNFLAERGFNRQQGSVYFGDPAKVNAVSCVLAVQELARQHPWFAPSVTDIRMLRIEENNDLNEAIQEPVALLR